VHIFCMLNLLETTAQHKLLCLETHKVSNFLAYIEAKYREQHYVPSQQPSVNEPLRSFKEKISFVTQNPKNPEYTCWQQAVPWIRSLIAGLSPQRPGLIRVNGGQSGAGTGFSQSSSVFPCQYIIPLSLSKLISSGECVIC
jgi:hypothetical protein